MKPDISVIMSVYNGEAYLAEAIESVCNQTFQNWELVIINDCSTDSTATILADWAAKDARINVHTNETNLKLPASLNKAIALCEGRYIARMDADDICLPTRLEKQLAFMEAHPHLALSSCRFMTLKNGVYASGGAGGRCDHHALRALLLVANPILHPGVIAKAEVLKQHLYDTALTCTEDLELWTRLVMKNQTLQILPECLMLYRLHDKQITGTTLARQRTEVLGIQRKYYGTLLQEMSDTTQEFYIRGVYFRENIDITRFLNYAKWLKKVAKTHFSAQDIHYALFEILAEYKRHGASKTDVAKAMVTFPPLFVLRELWRRKRAAKRDVAQCREVAQQLGLTQTGGTDAFPIFELK